MKLTTKIVNFFIGLAQSTGGEISGEKYVAPELQASARKLAAEGAVLLKNEGRALPVIAGETVAVFGRVQRDWFYVGYGSGGDVKASYRVNLIEGLKNAGVSYDRELAEIYEKWCVENAPDEGFWGHWPLNFPEMPLYGETVEKAAKRADKAIVVIGRAAGEDREQKLTAGGYYLNKAEIEMLDRVTTHFKQVIVLLDVGSIPDMAKLASYGKKISAILLVWQGGMESGNAAADLISGATSPSGKLPDTIANAYAAYPSCNHFGKKEYNNYTEDIYVGYRYFETFARDRVLYPFGFGLSYTTFEESFGLSRAGDNYRLDGFVRNTGACAGKDVVAAYVEAPQGKLGKAARVLVAFKKTKELAPGELERVVLEFKAEDVASYDDGGLSGERSSFVLEDGDYTVYVGADVRSAQIIGSFSHDKTVVSRKREVCCAKKSTAFPVLYPGVDEDGNIERRYRTVAVGTGELKARIEGELPAAAEKYDGEINFADVKSGKRTVEEFVSTLSLAELEALAHGDLKMNSPLGAAGNAGAFGGVTEGLRRKGIPAAVCTDGPSGIRLLHYASMLPCGTAIASSWNPELTEEVYGYLGEEMKRLGSDVLLGPGMNIHRDPLCGRNFEYFSEDPLLSGKIAAAVVRGVQSRGVSACPKHFACNNQETARSRTDSRVSERALREIYLKGFEICVKESKPYLLMTSYNRVNGVYSYHNYDLCTSLLRKEWGYKGCITTDWWTKRAKNPDFPGVDDDAYRIRAQADVLMPGGDRLGRYDGIAARSVSERGLTRGELERTAKNVLNLLLALPATREKIEDAE